MVFPSPESTSQNQDNALVMLSDIRLKYGSVSALRNIHLTIRQAEIHAVVGEHGAGKSSLGMILCGELKPHSGRMTFAAKEYRAFNLKLARQLGIEMVQQHTLSLNPYFSLADNFALDSAPLYSLWRKKRILQATQAFLKKYDIDLDAALPVEKYSVPERMFLDILKHIYPHPRLLILDEALEKLTAPHFKQIISILMRLKESGTSILFITHRIDDIYNLADRVSIIKRGEILLTERVKNIDKINLIKMAYMQVSAEQSIEKLNTEFYQLLKYNEAILRTLPVNLIVTDNENRVKLINDYCRRSFGLGNKSYLDLSLARLLSSQHEEVRELIEYGFSGQAEKSVYQAPLMIHQVKTISNLKVFPIFDGAARLGNIITFEDISEYDRLQRQVMLSEKLASVGLLAAGVAHEINNPLEIIYTYLSYMKYRFRTVEFHKAIDTLHEQVSDIANIVSNLQSFSDNRQGMIDAIDLNDIIRTMLNLIKHHAKEKRIGIRFEPYHEDLLITANKHEIKQVILNLFKNSFEAMPSGGEICIKTTQLTEAEDIYAQIIFTDSGPGICDENPNNIFLPFYSTKKGSEQNMGLGLSVSYGIVKKYQGTISVENLGEAGCQFLLRFPQLKN